MDSGNREALAEFLLRLRSNGITEQMPIECGQSMTAVSMVAKVLSALEVDSTHRVLELGTGTGYQAALQSLVCAIVLFPTLLFQKFQSHS